MNAFFRSVRAASVLAASLTAISTFGATTMLSDNYTAVNVNSGFALGEGLNSGINPPTTRLTGALSATMRYIKTGAKNDSSYTISGNKARMPSGSQSGRYSFSNDGVTTNDFGPALGISSATASSPIVYDIGITMNNGGTARMSMGFGTTEAGAGNWNFGLQIVSNSLSYQVYKRIRTAASGLGAELNSIITNAGTAGTEISLVMRVTDAGSEPSTYNSRVQVSIDGGTSWFYDTANDTALVNGFRFTTAGRFICFDQAINDGADTYDNFSLVVQTTPVWSGNGANANWSTATNWYRGIAPFGDAPVFQGTTRQINTNDISSLATSGLTLSNGGFALYGNSFTFSGGITNVTGDNTINNTVTLSANARIQATAGTLTMGSDVTAAARNLTVQGAGNTVINGAVATTTGTLTKSGTGSLALNGTNTYTGTTTVSQGALLVNGSTASGSTVSVAAAGTLGGTGVVNGSVSVSGTLSAGASVGKLTTGTLTLNSGGTNVWEISSATGTAGTDWDLVDAGASNVNVSVTSPNFNFKLVSQGLSNFDNNTSYLWPAISGSVQTFAANLFTVDNSGFTNDLAGGAFAIETNPAISVRFTNNHAPTASSVTYTFAAGAVVKPFTNSIVSFLAANTADPDADDRALISITSTNAIVTTNATDIIIESTNGVAESIQYIVRDVRASYRPGDTVRTATNYINIARTNATGAVTITATGGGGANLSFSGIPGYDYVIQRSPDLSTWTDVITNTAPGNGQILFSETLPYSPAYYRVRSN